MPKVRISSHRDGYRRAGIGFSKVGVVIDPDDLSEEQTEAIKGDPNLRAVAADDAEEAIAIKPKATKAKAPAAKGADKIVKTKAP